MIIYKGAEDKKWHQRDCSKLQEGGVLEEKTIGSIGDPDPPKEEMCRECFHFLFKAEDEEDRRNWCAGIKD